jgi:hypothetical protein
MPNNMDFDNFKKIFFPHLSLVTEEPDSDEDRKKIKSD